MTDRVESAPPRMWDRDWNALSSIDDPFEARPGRFWVTDPGTGESLGQVELGNSSVETAPQSVVDATFFALVADIAGAPRELVDTDTGDIAGRVSQSLYGRRTWRGGASSPLLFAGQYEDAESGWVYNRFRFYDPTAGVYGAQDPLGVAAKIATTQGYVDNPGTIIDYVGLKAHRFQTDNELLQSQIDKLTSNEKGRLGEILARDTFNGQYIMESPRSSYDSMFYTSRSGSSQTRISDISLVDGTIVEAKFVQSQGMTPQISDAIYQSKRIEGAGPLQLVTPSGTHLTAGLRSEIEAGNIQHIIMDDSVVEFTMKANGLWK